MRRKNPASARAWLISVFLLNGTPFFCSHSDINVNINSCQQHVQSVIYYSQKLHEQGGPKKTGPVWVLITQRWLVVERRVICQKFQNAVKNRPKRQICIVKHWCAMSVRRRFMLLAVTNIYAALCNVFETFWRLTTLIFDLLSCNLAHRLLLPWEMLYKFSVLLFVLKLWPGTDRRIGGRTGKTRNAVH